jgi:hypothetical protein
LAQVQLNAKIPFAFTVGTKSFAPGDYSVNQLSEGRALLIRNHKDGTSVITMVMPGEESKKAGTAVMVFKQYGNQYFLSAVSEDSRGWRLLPSRAEKELIAKVTAPQPVVVAAASK